MGITYKLLNKKMSSYDANYWSELQVLSAGGSISNKTLLKAMLPKSPGEEDEVYKYRIDNSYFIPYLGTLLGYYASSVINDPIKMNTDDDDSGMPAYYEEFATSVYRSGSFKITLNDHLRSVLEKAFLTQTSYTLVDFPSLPDEDEPPATKLEEEMLGMDRAYLCSIPASEVYNLREDEEGNLIWISIHNKTSFLEHIGDENLTNIETFTVYHNDHWDRYIYKWMENEQPPLQKAPPTETKSGKYNFGRVPVVRLTLPDPLYFGDKIGSIAKKIFQKMNALDYNSDRSLLQFMVAKLQNNGNDAPSGVAEDQNRAVNQTMGAGRVMVMAEKDSVEMIGGNPDACEWTQDHIQFLRDEMARIIGQSALSLANSKQMLARSMESKAFDHKATEIILEHLGMICRDYAEEVFDMVATGRSETDLVFTASGMSDYSQVSNDEAVNIQSSVSKLNLPSATFNADYAFETIKVLMSGHPEDRLEVMRKELDAGYKQQKEQAEEIHEVAVAPVISDPSEK